MSYGGLPCLGESPYHFEITYELPKPFDQYKEVFTYFRNN
jgi:hypothetical protein